jgi:hypothetical protein
MLVPGGAFLLEVAVFGAVWFGCWAVALSDVARRSPPEIRALGRLSRPAWIGLIIAIGPVSALAYLLYSRLRLRALARD